MFIKLNEKQKKKKSLSVSILSCLNSVKFLCKINSTGSCVHICMEWTQRNSSNKTEFQMRQEIFMPYMDFVFFFIFLSEIGNSRHSISHFVFGSIALFIVNIKSETTNISLSFFQLYFQNEPVRFCCVKFGINHYYF